MIIFIFSRFAEKKFRTLQPVMQERVIAKLKILKTHQDIFRILKKLHHFEPATHRLRIGFYRLILELKEQKKDDIRFLVLDIGDRKSVYR